MAHNSDHSDHNSSDESEVPTQQQRRAIPTRAERRNIPDPPAPPRYQWYRPHMQGFPGEINAYYRDSTPQSIVNHLVRIGGRDLVERFCDESPFAPILSIKKNGNAKRALHELLARELYRGEEFEFERLFHVNGHDVRFGPQEYSLVTGLRFGSTTFNPHGRNHVIPRTSIFHSYYEGRKVQVKQLFKDFTDSGVVIGTEDQYLAAANLLVYYYMLLCRDFNRTIDDWAWTLVEDPERWTTFPWGSWSFQILCHQISVAKKDPLEIGGSDTNAVYHLYGPVWALYFWAFEAFPDFGVVCASERNPSDLPRLRRWEMSHNFSDFHAFFNDPMLRVYQTLEPSTEELAQHYYLSLFEEADPLILRFKPNARHAWKKAPLPQRQTKEQRTMARVLDRLRCRDAGIVAQPRGRQPHATRANSDDGGPLPNLRARPSTSKRPRVDTSRPERSPGLICCVHGHPCPQGCDNDAWADKIMERIAQDESDNGVMARIAKFMAGHLKGIFGKSGGSSSHSRHSRGRAPSNASHVPALSRRSVDRAHRIEEGGGGGGGGDEEPEHAPGFEHMAYREPSPVFVAPERSRTPPIFREVEVEREESGHSSFAREIEEMDTGAWPQPNLPHIPNMHVGTSHQMTPSVPLFPDPSDPQGGEYSEHESDREGETPVKKVRHGGRTVRPSAALMSPYVQERPSYIMGNTWVEKYAYFRSLGSSAWVQTTMNPPHRLTQEMFDTIEHPGRKFTSEIMDLYTIYWWSRLQAGRSLAPECLERYTILLPMEIYYELREDLRRYHNHDTRAMEKSTLKYQKIPLSGNWEERFHGVGQYDIWHSATAFVFICLVADDHWVVCRVLTDEWKIEVYDSLLWTFTTLDERRTRLIQLYPIIKLWQRVLSMVDYWKQRTTLKKQTGPLKVVWVDAQYHQRDEESCGPFACMYVDRLFAAQGPRIDHVGLRYLARYRLETARRIFTLTEHEVDLE